jgi:hypothetical protein
MKERTELSFGPLTFVVEVAYSADEGWRVERIVDVRCDDPSLLTEWAGKVSIVERFPTLLEQMDELLVSKES